MPFNKEFSGVKSLDLDDQFIFMTLKLFVKIPNVTLSAVLSKSYVVRAHFKPKEVGYHLPNVVTVDSDALAKVVLKEI